MPRKIIQGKIISTTPECTATISVDRLKTYSKYKKKIKISKKFIVHNPDNKYKIGDMVNAIETRPVSKLKHFVINNQVKL